MNLTRSASRSSRRARSIRTELVERTGSPARKRLRVLKSHTARTATRRRVCASRPRESRVSLGIHAVDRFILPASWHAARRMFKMILARTRGTRPPSTVLQRAVSTRGLRVVAAAVQEHERMSPKAIPDGDLARQPPRTPKQESHNDLPDMRGQAVAGPRSRSPPLAAHTLLIGPPGAGKSMLAQRVPGIVPVLEPDEALVVTRLHSAAGFRPPGRGPMRARRPALISGGSPPSEARSPSPITACCSWTSSRSSRAARSTRFASRSRPGACGSPAPREWRASRRAPSSSGR